MSLAQQVIAAFEDQFKERPTLLVRSPGRVNLIGEHTDYNDGFVFPMAIDRNAWIAVRPRSDGKVKAFSLNQDIPCEFDATSFDEPIEGWGRYVQGVAWALTQHGMTLNGWDGMVASNVPIGSGLSSSAALELGIARCFAALGDFAWDAVEMARYCQEAENKWVGMNCGIMDQLIAAAGKKHKALLIDCRSLDMRQVPLPEEAVVVIMDTATRRGLVDSAYNERRQQCEAAAAIFGVPFLRDLSSEELTAGAHQLDKVLLKRSRHVISENERTVAAAHALETQDLVLFGQLMNESHDSLRDDYEVTNEALNVMVKIARTQSNCFGARMTGGGFGGCAVALVSKESAHDFVDVVSNSYTSQTGLKPTFFVCSAEAGTSLEVV